MATRRSAARSVVGAAEAPRFEALETRLLLDGNVTATVVGGHLYLTGDGADNVVMVELGAVNPSEWTVTGHGGTTINTTTPSATRLAIPDVTAGIWAWLHGGEDELIITDVAVPGTVWIDQGDGDSAANAHRNSYPYARSRADQSGWR